jgi:hypothetical protein
MSKQRRVRIVWSIEELELLAGKALELRMLRLYEYPLHLFRSAQAALPPERRRRSVKALGGIPWFVPAVDSLLAERAAQHQSDLVATILDWDERYLRSLSEWLDRHIKILEEIQAIHRTIELLGNELAQPMTRPRRSVG